MSVTRTSGAMLKITARQIATASLAVPKSVMKTIVGRRAESNDAGCRKHPQNNSEAAIRNGIRRLRITSFRELANSLLDALDAQLVDGDLVAWPVVRIARSVGNFVGNVLAFDDFTENGVFVVEPGSRSHSDEKLAAVGAGSGVGHGELAGLRMLQRRMKFIGEFVTRSTAPGAL